MKIVYQHNENKTEYVVLFHSRTFHILDGVCNELQSCNKDMCLNDTTRIFDTLLDANILHEIDMALDFVCVGCGRMPNLNEDEALWFGGVGKYSVGTYYCPTCKPVNTLTGYQIWCKNGYTWSTSMASHVTLGIAERYFLGKRFNTASYPQERLSEAVRVK